MDQTYEAKPITVKDSEKFEEYANELLSKWIEYKKLKNRMDILDATCKKYMLDNNLDEFKTEHGRLTIVEQSRRVLDRALIDDIEKYKVDSKVTMMFKCPK